MHRAIRRALSRPGDHFDRDEPSATRSVAIVVLLSFVTLGLLPAIVALLVSWSEIVPGLLEVLPVVEYAAGESAVAVPGLFLFSTGMLVLFPLGAWGLYSVLFHVLSWPVASGGSIQRTLQFTAWGFLPQLVASAVTLAGVAVTFPGTAETLWGLGVTFPARTYAVGPDPSPVLFAAELVGVLCTLWSASIWVHAIAAARGLRYRQAAVVVAGPVVLTLAVTPPLSGVLFSLLA